MRIFKPTMMVAAMTLASLSLGNAVAAPGNAFVTLGTMGGPVPSPVRSQPSNLLMWNDRAYLVDVGDGAVQQVAKAGVRLPALRAIFISHLHFDHTGGLAAVLGLRYQVSEWQRLPIYGPPGTRKLVAGIVASMQPAADAGYGITGSRRAQPADTVDVIEMTDGSTIEIDGMKVVAAQNSHYSFAPGSADDKHFKSLSFRFNLPDRSIVYTGDTGPSAAVEHLARDADLLVSEMIDLDATLAAIRKSRAGGAPMPEAQYQGAVKHLSSHHLSPTQLGELAARAGVKRVVVTHLAPGTTDPATIGGYVLDIQKQYKGPVTVASDLERH
jgi:ribonuclease BN (tRNA processing enzyme)